MPCALTRLTKGQIDAQFAKEGVSWALQGQYSMMAQAIRRPTPPRHHGAGGRERLALT